MSKSGSHMNLEMTFQWTKLFMNLMCQSIPSMSIPPERNPGIFFDCEFPTPLAKSSKHQPPGPIKSS